MRMDSQFLPAQCCAGAAFAVTLSLSACLSVHLSQTGIVPKGYTGWAKNVIPLVQCNTCTRGITFLAHPVRRITNINKKLSYRRGTAQRSMFLEVWQLERFQLVKVAFKVIQGIGTGAI